MNVIGRFYYKQTRNGNLIGEFSNNKSERNYTESANILSGFFAEFIGNYTATWNENAPTSLDLIITNKPSTNGIFTLTWSENGKAIFKGEGFIVDNILIGDYQDI